MDFYRNHFIEFIKDWRYMIPTSIVTIMSFGFTLNNAVISTDDTAFDLHFDYYGLIGQGRFGAILLDKIFRIYQFNPFFLDFCAVLCFFVSAMLFCIIFKDSSKNKLHPLTYTVFSCFMITYPLMSEIFCYMTASFTIGICFLLTALALILINLFMKNKSWYLIAIPTFLLAIIISCYQSFGAVYVCGVFAILILKYLYGDEQNQKFKAIILSGLVYAVPLVLGSVLQVAITSVLYKVMNTGPAGAAADTIYYTTLGFGETLVLLKNSIVLNYGIVGLWYLPIAIYVISIIVTLLMTIVYTIKYKNPTILLLFLGLGFSTILLSIIQGVATPYRACQVFAIFIAFIMMLLTQNALTIKKVPIIKHVTLIVMFLMIFFQAQNLHHWFYVDYLRFVEEKNIITAVSHRLYDNFDTTKPVVFTGTVSLHSLESSDIYIPNNGRRLSLANKIKDIFQVETDFAGKPFVQTNVHSCINYFNTIPGPRGETNIYFRMNGFYFATPTAEMSEVSKGYLPSMEEWPSKKSILETEEFIIVNF